MKRYSKRLVDLLEMEFEDIKINDKTFRILKAGDLNKPFDKSQKYEQKENIPLFFNKPFDDKSNLSETKESEIIFNKPFVDKSNLSETNKIGNTNLMMNEESGKIRNQNDGILEKKVLKKSSEKMKPNYYVSIPISNPETLKNIENFQNGFVDKNKKLKPSKTEELHVTVCLLRLETNDQIESAKKSFQNFKFPTKLKFDLRGTGEFGNKIIYITTQNKENRDKLISFSKNLCEAFKVHFSIFEITKF
ncbi:A-kinase anchor protein 7 isoforms alpha and beta, variant 2 [Bonamia ostreae]|uniref:A-kinase anchor protein 7 isoforms alpha and beta, variant 2 n=1 Tax=Bonamia ostreae TaxID=126728 RepID=A0ABV2AG25_9EUKA